MKLNLCFFQTVLVFAFLIISASCSTTPKSTSITSTPQVQSELPSEFDKNFNKLEVGQSKSEIEKNLGAPSLREVVNGIEIWHYNSSLTSGAPKKLEFQSGKLIGFSLETRPVVQLDNESQLPPKNRKIGQACKKDEQCELNNCHFSTCAGRNNCTRVAGDICALDADCCDSLCDFGTCKKK